MDGTADDVLWEEDIEGNCTVAMEGLTVTDSSQLSDVFVAVLYTAVHNFNCDNY